MWPGRALIGKIKGPTSYRVRCATKYLRTLWYMGIIGRIMGSPSATFSIVYTAELVKLSQLHLSQGSQGGFAATACFPSLNRKSLNHET